MTLLDLIGSSGTPPQPWTEGRTIPWDEPEFSRRMLAQHLSQEHDRASRRGSLIERHLDFLRSTLELQQGARVLDLGCGPGLYAHRLAAAGYTCVGIDFAPASIEYATAEAARQGLDCRFELADIRTAVLGDNHDLVMLLYGELNLFPRTEAVELLKSCRQALAPRGHLVLEVHDFALVKGRGEAKPSWMSAQSGIFSDRPHLRLDESFWLAEPSIAAGRHWVVDAASAEVTKYGWTMQAYTDAGYRSLLADAGLSLQGQLPSLTGEDDGAGFPVLVATTA